MRFLFALGLALCTSAVSALSQSSVGVVDWQKQLVGIPLTSSPLTNPIFHRVNGGVKGTRSVILVATQSNVLAALDAPSGNVVWRHIHEEDEPILAYKANQDGLACVAGPGGSTVRMFEALTGHIVWETRLHNPRTAYLLQPANMGVSLSFAQDKTPDLFVLVNGHTVHRLNGLTGEIKWSWTSEDETSSIVYAKLVATEYSIYVIGLTKSYASYTLHVTTLSSSGSILSSQPIPSSVKTAMDEVLVLTSSVSPHPRLVWLEGKTIKSVGLPPDLVIKSPINTPGFEKIIDVQLLSFGTFVALKEDGSSVIMKLDGTGQGLRTTWEFADSARSHAYTESIFGGGLDKAGSVYITRLYWSHFLQACSIQMYAPHAAEGRGMVTGFSFPFDTSQHGVLLHTAIDVANPKDYLYIGRLALTTSTGSFQLWQQDQIQWHREESLATVKAVELVDLPEKVVVKSGHKELEGFFGRLARQSGELNNLPGFIIRFGKRFLTGSYTSPSTAVTSSSNELYRDTFGFKKLIIAATSTGKVVALDSTTGNEVWGRLLSLSDEAGKPIDGEVKIFSLKGVEDGDGNKAEVVLVMKNGTATDSEDSVQTVLYHFNALTGKTIGKDEVKGIASPQYMFNGAFQDAFLVQGGKEKSIGLVDHFTNVHVYPPSSIPSFVEIAPKIHFPLVQGAPGYRRISGFKVTSAPVDSTKNIFSTYSTWTNSFAAQHESVHSVTKSGMKSGTPLASFGKVLGNRDTMYKYINPHLVAVVTTPTTISSTERQQCGVYLIDSVKGNIIYHAPLYLTQHNAGRRCGEEVQVSLTENWLVFSHYSDDTSAGKAKGWRMVTVELYEGERPNEKISSPELSSYSEDKTKIKVFQQSFVFPHGVVAMANTVTKFGISLKDIIVATDNHQIQAVPRRLLDPRRPKGKPTTAEQEEGLVPFDPILPDDTKRTLSHSQSAARIRSILTTPSQLESTSIIFAHGLDLFQSRTSPSNTFDLLSEDFNRVQLVLTICGLVLAIGITRPLVKAKQLKLKWYPYS